MSTQIRIPAIPRITAPRLAALAAAGLVAANVALGVAVALSPDIMGMSAAFDTLAPGPLGSARMAMISGVMIIGLSGFASVLALRLIAKRGAKV
jgi:hypothetical protein